MAEYVGQPVAKVILRRKQFQWILPGQKEFDIQLKEFATGRGQENFRSGNAYYEPAVGAMMVKPLYANRNNYVVNSPTPNEGRYVVATPNGVEESINEKKKRVWRSYPTISQQVEAPFTAYKEPWEQKESDYSPLIQEEPMDARFGQSVGGRRLPVTWIHQKESNPNVEWFLAQEYGNFTNESFWIDVHKRPGDDPDPIEENDFNKFAIYGENNEVKSYFAIRIGWSVEKTQDLVSDSGNVNPVSNQGAFDYLGPFDIVFPIDKQPFIWDHQGDGLKEDDPGITYKSYRGYVASRNDDPSWILSREITDFRLYFFVMKGKLIIRSNFSNAPWVFPQSIGSKASERTKARYENFFVPPGKVCIMGRGFKMRFNYNPMEFDIYNPDGTEKETHASVTLVPLQSRDRFTTGPGGWSDYRGRTGDNALFVEIPYSRGTRNPDSGTYVVDDVGAYGFDIVEDPYPDHGATSNSYTSMMIPVEEEPSSIKRLVNVRLRPPDSSEGMQIQQNANYNIETTTIYPVLFTNYFLTVDMNCAAPDFEFGLYNEEIGKRFASPIVWRMKGKHVIPRLPTPPELDITNVVKTINHSTDANNYFLIRQNCKVECIIPKEYQFSDFGLESQGVTSREELLEWFQGGVREIEVSLGWIGTEVQYRDPALYSLFPNDQSTTTYGGQMVKVFTGLARSGPKVDTYGEDTITLNCDDRLEILDAAKVINSPIFDGMNVDKAFLACATMTGVPLEFFDVVSDFAHRHILPMGYTFQEPKIRFNSGMSVLECVQQIAQYFLHVIRTEPDGTIILTDIYSNSLKTRSGGNRSNYEGAMVIIDDLDLTHESYVFYEDGSIIPGNNPFQRIYEQFTFDKSIKDQVTQIQILSVDRTDGSYIADATAHDVPAVEDPTRKNFVGYRKPVRIEQPAFGDIAHVNYFRRLLALHMFQPPIKINFFTYGRPTIRPLDIIEIVHRDDLVLEKNSTNRLKYRVLSVKHTVNPTDGKWGFRTDIEAEHI